MNWPSSESDSIITSISWKSLAGLITPRGIVDTPLAGGTIRLIGYQRPSIPDLITSHRSWSWGMLAAVMVAPKLLGWVLPSAGMVIAARGPVKCFTTSDRYGRLATSRAMIDIVLPITLVLTVGLPSSARRPARSTARLPLYRHTSSPSSCQSG